MYLLFVCHWRTRKNGIIAKECVGERTVLNWSRLNTVKETNFAQSGFKQMKSLVHIQCDYVTYVLITWRKQAQADFTAQWLLYVIHGSMRKNKTSHLNVNKSCEKRRSVKNHMWK